MNIRDIAIKVLKTNFSLVTLAVCTIISFILSIIAAMFPCWYSLIMDKILSALLYLELVAFVGVLIDMRLRLMNIENNNEFKNMLEARPYIIKSVISSMQQGKNKPAILNIYGMRLSTITVILSEILLTIKNENISSRKLVIYLYYCDPEFLKKLSSENSNRNSNKFSEQMNSQIERINNNIKELKRIIDEEKLDIVTIHYRKYAEIPTFWAYQIDNKDILWGYFMWDKENFNWRGPRNNCFIFNSKRPGPIGFIDWVENNFERLKEWSKEENE